MQMLHNGLTPIGYPLGADTASDVLLPPLKPAAIFWSLLATVAAGASAYHGYKRNDSIGWGVAWGLLGGIAPIITVPIALAQGFGRRSRS